MNEDSAAAQPYASNYERFGDEMDDGVTHIAIATMCPGCGENQQIAMLTADNEFTPHVNQRTGQPCVGHPRPPYQASPVDAEIATRVARVRQHVTALEESNLYLRERLAYTELHLVQHSTFAYPHFRLWHMLFDGTWLCRCWRSREMKIVRASKK